MEQFDEKFSRKTKEAFESYNADHLAGEGWNSYLSKYGHKRRRAFIVPLWARVASVAAILAIAVLLTNRLNHRNADEPGNQLAQQNQNKLTEPAVNKEETTSGTIEIIAAKAVTPSANTDVTSPGQASQVIIGKSGPDWQAGMEKTGYEVSASTVPVLAEAVKSDGLILAEANNAAGSLLTETDAVEGSRLAENQRVAEMSPEMKLPDNQIEIRLTADGDAGLKLNPKKTLQVFDEIPRERMTTTIMGGLSGMMASIDNATSTSQGVSIGFYVEQQLTRRISVRPGLAMAKHNYAMESMSGGNIAMDYAAPELNGLSGSTTSYKADIEVLSMEVPVNFVFSLRKRGGSNLFVTAGASTVFYLDQRLSGNFNNTYTKTTVDAYGGISYESMTTSVKVESEQELLNRVDLMGLANFSAGYSMPFGKVTQISFEPFVQLPMRDLTSLNLRIRYGGLSMKIRF
jgi:hypothetical protein